MARDFVLLHGLPGSGKSSVCRCLMRKTGWFYANIGAAADFVKVPMPAICSRLYLENGAGAPLITEGFMQSRVVRDRFVTCVRDILSQSGVFLIRPLIIFWDEPDLRTLAKRRNRTVEEYEQLQKETEIGSRQYEYTIYKCGTETLEERADRILDLIG